MKSSERAIMAASMRILRSVCVVAAVLAVAPLTACASTNQIIEATRTVEQIQKALELYYDAYGTYPPVASVIYEFENATNQSAWFRDVYLPQHNDPGSMDVFFADAYYRNVGIGYLGYRYGLVSFLWPRDRGNQRHLYDSDNYRDIVAKYSWAPYLSDVRLTAGSAPHPSPAGLITESPYTNDTLTLIDPWGVEYRYSSVMPFTNYVFLSCGPDRQFATSDDIAVRVCRGRSVARHGDEVARATLLALSNAIAAIDASMNSGTNIYPPWNVLKPSGTGSSAADIVSLASCYIPGSLQEEARYASPSWVRLSPWSLRADEMLVTNYTFLAVNCSGLLDANEVGGSARRSGDSPAELSLSGLSDLADASKFLVARTNDHIRYESLSELNVLQSGKGLHSGDQFLNFVTQSHYPAGSLYGTNTFTDSVYIGGDIEDLMMRETSITQALVKSGIDHSDAAFVFTNLLDYLDADSIPRNLGDAYTEAVPMINELVITGLVSAVSSYGTNYASVQSDLRIEWWYPFVRPSSNNFFIQAQVEGVLTNCSGTNWVDISAGGVRPSTYTPNIDLNLFGVVMFDTPVGNVSIAAKPGDVLRIALKLRVQVTLDDSSPTLSNVVDATPYPTNVWIAMTSPNLIVPELGAPMIGFSASKEVVDPRFNWSSTTGMPVFWRTPTNAPSLGKTNEWTLASIGKYSPLYGCNTDGEMYVSDSGRLKTPGELSNLLRGSYSPMKSMWECYFNMIRLSNTTNPPVGYNGADKCLDYFTVRTNQGPLHGLVNLNTTNANVLASLFRDVPLGYGSLTNGLSSAELGDLIGAIVSTNLLHKSFFTNVSDLAILDLRKILPARSDLERNALIANSSQLMGMRQNLFTVVVGGAVVSPYPGYFGSTSVNMYPLASQAAVAVVWRDPFPGTNGLHDNRILFFKWLKDAGVTIKLDPIDVMAQDLGEAVADELLQADFVASGSSCRFYTTGGVLPAGRTVRRVAYYRDGDQLMREVEPVSLTGGYPVLTLPAVSVLASNLSLLTFCTSDGQSHTTNLPAWVEVQVETAEGTKASRRIPLSTNRLAMADHRASTMYWLGVQPSTHGFTDAINGWYESGRSVAVTGTAEYGYMFLDWSGDVCEWLNPLRLRMDRPYRITPNFGSIVTANGTSKTWLKQHYGPVNNYDLIDQIDDDGDGFSNWQEYLTGTDPLDALSSFRIVEQGFAGGSNYVKFTGSTNSGVFYDFRVLRMTNLLSSGELLSQPVRRSDAVGGTNIFWDTSPPAGPVFYRPCATNEL